LLDKVGVIQLVKTRKLQVAEIKKAAWYYKIA
jgi:hypothetical protein